MLLERQFLSDVAEFIAKFSRQSDKAVNIAANDQRFQTLAAFAHWAGAFAHGAGFPQ